MAFYGRVNNAISGEEQFGREAPRSFLEIQGDAN